MFISEKQKTNDTDFLYEIESETEFIYISKEINPCNNKYVYIIDILEKSSEHYTDHEYFNKLDAAINHLVKLDVPYSIRQKARGLR